MNNSDEKPIFGDLTMSDLEAIERIEEYTEGLDFDDFLENKMVQDAVVRRLEIIGEAVKNIPEEIRNKKPEIE